MIGNTKEVRPKRKKGIFSEYTRVLQLVDSSFPTWITRVQHAIEHGYIPYPDSSFAREKLKTSTSETRVLPRTTFESSCSTDEI